MCPLPTARNHMNPSENKALTDKRNAEVKVVITKNTHIWYPTVYP